VRLLAGQDVTGGWNYRCGAVGKKNQEEIVALLRQMNQPGKAPGLMGLPVVKPGAPGLPGTPVRKPGALDGKPVRKPGGLDGKPVKNPPALDGTPVGPKRKELPPSGPAVGAPASPGGTPTRKDKPAPDKAPTGSLKVTPPLPARVGLGPAVKPGGAAAGPPEAGAVKAPEGGALIPKNLRFLAAFRDRNPLLDGAGRFRTSTDPRARTDNSNTQFALLAIWVAQRHDVPMQRTLDLLARRYEKSQNGDGSWDYLFYYGGCPADLVDRKFGSHRPQMTCVGLMGLALGHGLRPAGAGKVPPAPQIVNGFAALSAYIGQPTGAYLPGPQNLYFLWSVERVAMLYDLPTVGGKDWYRWGAEILVANQQPLGNWDKGGYIGTSRPLDTSLALLFLKRANLVKDLTARLPFDKKELDRTITLKVGSLPASPGAAPDLPARNKR
jgi:hypothetical protein